MPLQPCSLFFGARWCDSAGILWGGGKDALVLHKIPLHELPQEGSCPLTGGDLKPCVQAGVVRAVFQLSCCLTLILRLRRAEETGNWCIN